MKRVRRLALHVIAALSALPGVAAAHAFDDRYDLPAPLPYFVAGATAAVALSFLVTAAFARRAPAPLPHDVPLARLGALVPVARAAGGILSVLLLAATMLAGWYGTRDPVMNLAPTLVWIVFWPGLTLLTACIGNVWSVLDPWRTMFGWLEAAVRALGRRGGIALGLPYPRALGAWPAVALLLAIGWLEVVYPQGAEPHRLASIALAWSLVTLAGSVCFGLDAWQRNADVFAIYFSTLGRFAPLARAREPNAIAVRVPASALLLPPAPTYALVAFVLAMLATVLFDGLLAGDAWWAFQARIARAVPFLASDRANLLGTLGLIAVWLVFLGAYVLACTIGARLGGVRARELVLAYALTLVPIAIAYNVAHNFSSLVVQGQQIVPLLSDPLGLHWDLLGTAGYTARIGIVDARTTWYVAIGAIVSGHVISIWLAHRVALRELGSVRRALVASIPLTVLMLGYTAVSLTIIAEPMVKFGVPSDSAMEPIPYALRLCAADSA
jgi:hypothetical protein